MTAYQKLKKENGELKKMLRILVIDPASLNAFGIRSMVKTEYEKERAFLYGDGTKSTLKGITLK